MLIKNQTPLIVASIYGHFQVVQHLVSVAGCNVNAQDKNGNTALYCASIKVTLKLLNI